MKRAEPARGGSADQPHDFLARDTAAHRGRSGHDNWWPAGIASPHALSMTHDRTSASAVAVTQPAQARHLRPSVPGCSTPRGAANLRRVYGETVRRTTSPSWQSLRHLWKLAENSAPAGCRTTAAGAGHRESRHVADATQQGALRPAFRQLGRATVAGIGSFPHMQAVDSCAVR
jgi:hypothetical protein